VVRIVVKSRLYGIVERALLHLPVPGGKSAPGQVGVGAAARPGYCATTPSGAASMSNAAAIKAFV
jgi:hypothetical protein